MSGQASKIFYLLEGDFMVKKKFGFFVLVACCLIVLSACGKNEFNLSNHVIEKREQLFTAHDQIYSVSFSTGMRETQYNFDGIVNEMVPFGVLTLTRNDNHALPNDTYSYIVRIDDQNYSGFLTKSNSDNSYSADLEVATTGSENIVVKISFTGYTFDQTLENTTNTFQVDSNSALNIAQRELKENINDLLSDKNIKIEVVMKIMKDYSSEDLKRYYWYVGIVSTNGNTMGILIDANNGDIIAKKV